MKDHERQAWNVAADLAINDDLDEAGCKTFASDGMLPENLGAERNQTPHHYFDLLRQKMSGQQPPPPQQGQSGGQSQQQGQGQQGTGPSEKDGQPFKAIDAAWSQVLDHGQGL